MKAPDRYWDFEKDISGCGLFGAIHRKGELIDGAVPICAMASMHDRGNGLGGGFAAYGIYPHRKDDYAFHLLCDNHASLDKAEECIKHYFNLTEAHPIPTRKTLAIKNPPLLWRIFATPKKARPDWENVTEEDYVINVVMHINIRIDGAFVVSSGKNMGAFKGVGYPEDIAEFFRLDEYRAYMWTGHNRFPTNTPGWWGGAHPFTLLDWAIVHNGEISSYGINRRYLMQHGYECTLQTDTEVVAYLMDLLIRRHRLSKRMASRILAPPFWDEIERMDAEEKQIYTTLRMVYGPAMLNGPFSILVTESGSMMGLNDRVKLRPLVVAEKGDVVFMSSEESAIRQVQPDLDRVWDPKAGEAVIVELEGGR